MIRSFNEFKYFKSFRIPVSSSDDIQFLVEVDDDGTSDRGVMLKDAKMINVSITGLGFTTEYELAVDDEVVMSINYKKLRFDINGKVVRVLNDPSKSSSLSERPRFSYGVEINELEDREKMKRFLGQLINYFQPERLKQSMRDLALSEHYADMNEGLEMLSLLISLYKDVGQYAKKEGFIVTLLDEATRVLNASRAVIYLINTEKNELEAVECTGHALEKQALHFDYRQGVMGQVFTTGLGVNLDHSSEQLRFLEKDYPAKLKSVLAYPLHNAEDKVIGVLQLENKRNENRFSDEDEQVLRVFALVFSSFYGNYNPISEKSLVRRFSLPQARSIIFIGRSEATTDLRKTISKLKDASFPVLLQGEHGTGKSLYGRILHAEGARSDKDFELIYCQGIEPSILDSLIFGDAHEIGALSKCQGGTLCLEEITELPMALQIKLLKFVNAPAEDKNSQMNIRFVFTTSCDLSHSIAQNKLHPELYQYMSQFVVNFKPLRERKKDIMDLIDFYLMKECKTHGLLPKVLSEELKEKLMDYSWPENVTELKRAMSRLVLYNQKHHVITEIDEQTLPIVEAQLTPSITTSIPYVNDFKIELKDRVAIMEREMIWAEIKRCKGNKSKAAIEMGISREALRKKLLASDEVLERLTGVKPVDSSEERSNEKGSVIDLAEKRNKEKDHNIEQTEKKKKVA